MDAERKTYFVKFYGFDTAFAVPGEEVHVMSLGVGEGTGTAQCQHTQDGDDLR